MNIFVDAMILVVALFVLTVFFGAPYVPTRKKWALQAMDLAKIDKDDVVVDLGSGDGVILKLAAARGARAVGFEINPILVAISWLRLRKVRSRTKTHLRNFWHTDLPIETTTIYVFIESRDLHKLRKYLVKQKRRIAKNRPLKIVSFGFEIPEMRAKKQLGGMNLYEI